MTRSSCISAVVICQLAGSTLPGKGQGTYATFEYGVGASQMSGTGSFGMAHGVPDFNFTILDPNNDFLLSGIRTGERLDDSAWQAAFEGAPTPGYENLLVQIKGPMEVGERPTSVTINFDFTAGGGTPAGVALGIAVIDLEVEDAIFSAVDASGVVVPDAVIAGWFQNTFDGDQVTGGNSSFAQWDADNVALVAESDFDGLLDDALVSAISTESASGWLSPDIPLNSFSIEYRNRTNGTSGIPNPGAANAHFVLAVIPESVPEPSSTFLIGLAVFSLLGYRRRS